MGALVNCHAIRVLPLLMSATSQQPHIDAFGNPIDPTVGYARGKILRSSIEESQRLAHAQKIATQRLKERGAGSITVFTGNQRAFPVRASDLELRCEEWFGPGLIQDELKAAVLTHMDAGPENEISLFNRSSACIIALIIALSAGRPVVSGVPPGSRSHASVKRGCNLAGVELHEHSDERAFQEALARMNPALAIITPVTSNLDRIEEASLEQMLRLATRAGAITFVDDAYGARIRPILHDGTSAIRLGADVVVTNGDKAGLIGPRAGILVGRPNLVSKVAAQGAELGMEARGPIMAAMTRSLQAFDPALLLEERRLGEVLTGLMRERYGADRVSSSDLGPIIDENDMLHLMMERAGKSPEDTTIVPAEATSALGVLLLRDHGILTTNTHGQPGAKASLRLRPTPEAMETMGDMQTVVGALDQCIGQVAALLDDTTALSALILGEVQ